MKRRKTVIYRCDGDAFIRGAREERSLVCLLHEAFPGMDARKIQMSSMTQYFIIRKNRIIAILSHARKAQARNGRTYGNMIFNVATKKEYRGMGLMTLILDALFRDGSKKTFHLEVYRDNDPAISLYHKNGFRVIDTTRDLFGRPILIMKSTPALRRL